VQINMAKQNSDVSSSELFFIPKNKKDDVTEREADYLERYHIKISMIKPFEVVDLWVRKPDEKNVLELFMHELSSIDPSKYFIIQISKV